MRVAKPVIAALVDLAAVYVAYPGLTLYRLDRAVQDGDAAPVAYLIDWPTVRAGIDQDIADRLAGGADPAAIASGDELAPFGFSFTRRVAAKAAASALAPARLVAMLHRAQAGATGFSLRAAAFEGPTRIRLDFGLPRRAGTLGLRMHLEGGVWKVTRLWLPANLLDAHGAGADPTEAARLAVRAPGE